MISAENGKVLRILGGGADADARIRDHDVGHTEAAP